MFSPTCWFLWESSTRFAEYVELSLVGFVGKASLLEKYVSEEYDSFSLVGFIEPWGWGWAGVGVVLGWGALGG